MIPINAAAREVERLQSIVKDIDIQIEELRSRQDGQEEIISSLSPLAEWEPLPDLEPEKDPEEEEPLEEEPLEEDI